MNKKRDFFNVLLFSLFALMALAGFFYVTEGKKADPTPAWKDAFNFATSTPEVDLNAEGGWWDESSEMPTPLPTMPDSVSGTPTPTPLEATQTALALTPSITPTRTPLFDVNVTATAKDQ